MMIFNENSDFIRWEKRFELGIPVIDAQHKRLVELCNDLYLTIVRNKYRAMQPEWQEAFSIFPMRRSCWRRSDTKGWSSRKRSITDSQ